MAKWLEKITERILTVSALISAFVAVLIFGFLLIFGLPLLQGGQWFGLLAHPWSPREGLYGIHPMLRETVFRRRICLRIPRLVVIHFQLFSP